MLSAFSQVGVDSRMQTFEVSHQRAHHTARQTATNEQRCHLAVTRVDPVAEEVIDELLRQFACLHVGFHVDIFHQEACLAEHRLDGDHIRVHHTPAERFDSHIEHVTTGFGNLEHRGYGETGACMAVVLDDDIRMFGLDGCHDGTEHCRTADTCHILQAYLLCAVGNQLLG